MSVFIERIKIKNLLSFDEEGIDFELKPLNVLIGANGSGKSNFVNALKLITTIMNRKELVDSMGGARELTWKGNKDILSEFELKLNVPVDEKLESLIWKRKFSGEWIYSELIGSENSFNHEVIQKEDDWLYSFNLAGHSLHPLTQKGDGVREFHFENSRRSTANYYPDRDTLWKTIDTSRLRRLKDICQQNLNHISFDGFIDTLSTITLRTPSLATEPTDRMKSDGRNMGVFLGELHRSGVILDQIVASIQEIYPNIKDLSIYTMGGNVYVMLKEKDMISGMLQTRLSDGILRLLTYLLILKQENLPKLLCLEEPENGFHPQALHILAKAIVEASNRTQIIITTHSPTLLNYFSPEDIVVCDRPDGGGTNLHRLDEKKLEIWLKKFNLGELWLSNVIGGTIQ